MRDYTRYGGSRLDGGMATWEEAVCKVCGKTYMRTSQHVYKECCSWSCLNKRRKREAEAEKAYEEAYEEAMERLKIQKETAKAEETIAKCEAKIAYFDAIAKAARNEKTRHNAIVSRGMWQTSLQKAKKHLARLQS